MEAKLREFGTEISLLSNYVIYNIIDDYSWAVIHGLNPDFNMNDHFVPVAKIPEIQEICNIVFVDFVRIMLRSENGIDLEDNRSLRELLEVCKLYSHLAKDPELANPFIAHCISASDILREIERLA